MKNIFIFGASDFDLAQIRASDDQGQYRLHELYSYMEASEAAEFPVKELYKGALKKLADFPGQVDAIVGCWDFPISTLLPLLRKPYNLPSPSLEAILKCEHKYWSRLEQSRSVPECIPDFCKVDPFADDYREQITVNYPFWIKPVKSVCSHLAFKVRNDQELDHAIACIREGISRFAKPFNYLLQLADLPEDVAAVDGNHCIVESIISKGRQCTLEGYVYDGEVTVYGVFDSVREGKHRSSFSRYQYPSSIPRRIQGQMVTATEKFLRQIRFDNGPFNIEYYWDSADDQIRLLEINTRISRSHCPLFHKVDGETHHKVMIKLALGERPEFPYRQGKYKVAAKFMWRVHHDARVVQTPSPKELEAIQQQFPGVDIELEVEEGDLLSSLKEQDSYSFELAAIFIGADSQGELLRKYRDVKAAMHLQLEPVD